MQRARQTRHILLLAALVVAVLVALCGTLVVFFAENRDGNNGEQVAGTEANLETPGVDAVTPTQPPTPAPSPTSTPSDLTAEFTIPAGDPMFAVFVAFIPPGWEVAPGEDVPIGAVVGQVTLQLTLGLINGACEEAISAEFTMLNASLDKTESITLTDSDGSGFYDTFEDKDGSRLLDSVEKYPIFLDRIVGNAPPIRRAVGVDVAVTQDWLLQTLIFEPGTVIDPSLPSDEALGYPAVTVLQDFGDPQAYRDRAWLVTDTCSPASFTGAMFGLSKDNACTDIPGRDRAPSCVRTGGVVGQAGRTTPDESGHVLLANSESASGSAATIILELRDADGDGIENALDTCPFDVNLGDPRASGAGDADQDGLDAACDPNDGVFNTDQEVDGYLNRLDNCPHIANPGQTDSDADQIGDACDPEATKPNGAATVVGP